MPATATAGDLEAIRRFAVASLRAEQDADLLAFGVKFDVYYLESSLYAEGRVDAAVNGLVASGKTYEKDGALWLRTTDYGDDKDRVVRKSDGTYTYFVPDVAYHVTKWQRGFRKVINVQGTDHHSTVTRVRAGLQALGIGIPADYPDYVLHSLVKVMRGGEEVKISKRAGLLRHGARPDRLGGPRRRALLPRVAQGRLGIRLRRGPGAREERGEPGLLRAVRRTPAYAASSRSGAATRASSRAWTLHRSSRAHEMALLARLMEYPEVVTDAARDLAPHAVAFYLRELAAEFHSYYNATRILVDDETVKFARLALACAVRDALRNGLKLIGVAAPEKM